jgi:SpoVK/Ycf46/Vps4 family AAA+-type ATPase
LKRPYFSNLPSALLDEIAELTEGYTPHDIQAIYERSAHLANRGNLVNTSVTSVDTSADCASGSGMLTSTDTLEELPIVCTPMRGGWW